MYFHIHINWTSPFPILGLLSGIFHFYSNFKRNFHLQTVENLIRRCIFLTLEYRLAICLWEGNFFRANRIQHQGAIEHHASIDRLQIQHEHLQLLLIHLNQILQIRYMYLRRNHYVKREVWEAIWKSEKPSGLDLHYFFKPGCFQVSMIRVICMCWSFSPTQQFFSHVWRINLAQNIMRVNIPFAKTDEKLWIFSE